MLLYKSKDGSFVSTKTNATKLHFGTDFAYFCLLLIVCSIINHNKIGVT